MNELKWLKIDCIICLSVKREMLVKVQKHSPMNYDDDEFQIGSIVSLHRFRWNQFLIVGAINSLSFLWTQNLWKK